MEQARYDFGWAQSIRADAVGKPGQRRFRLRIESEAGVACIWLEKEQLYALALAVKQLLADFPKGGQSVSTAALRRHRVGDLKLEFTAGEMFLQHDESTGLAGLIARDIKTPQQRAPTFRCSADKGQLEALSEEALKVCSAGRPLCPLCYAPMEPQKHICPKSNGHVRESSGEGGYAQA